MCIRDSHDTEWGLPVTDEQALYERICLEAFQAGLSWLTILAKRPAFRAAFARFAPDLVARLTEADVARLMSDSSIVRNRAKIEATIRNARATIAQRDQGGLADLIWSYQPDSTPVPLTAADVPSRSEVSQALSKDCLLYTSPSPR